MVTQMPLVEVLPGSNIEIANYVRGEIQGSDYANRIPEADQANIDNVLNSMFNWAPSRNQFVDALFNSVGANILHHNAYTNRWAKFKRGMMETGDTIEEVQLGLIKAIVYNPDQDYLEDVLFGRKKTPAASRFHKIDRQDIYPLTINTALLKRAFTSAQGLSTFVAEQMQIISNSENFDEFEIMVNLINEAYAKGGMFEVNVPDISVESADEEDAKRFLKVVRAWAATLPLKPSPLYNPAKMPITVQPSDLELFLTPMAQANIDVEGLAQLFNIEKGQIMSRITLVPPDDITIPNFQGFLSIRNFFVCADSYLSMENQPNAAGRYINYFRHHDGIYSVSPFAPAILLTSNPSTPIYVQEYEIDGISALTIIDAATDATVNNTTVTRGNAYIVQAQATTNPAGGPNSAVRLAVIGARSSYTTISQYGVLRVGFDEDADSIVVRATSVANNEWSADTTITVTGPKLYGSLGLGIDADDTTLNNVAAPTINPETVSVAANTPLEVDPGEWDQGGVGFAFQWKSNGTNVGTNSPLYQPVTGDIGHTITVAVTASKTGRTSGTITTPVGASVTA